jgi:1-acyl-sn-glycerol-3-phosphate acyltransferase
MMIRNRKGFITLALQTGAQIVPTYCFGSTHLFYVGSSKWLQKLSRLLRTSLILFWGKYGLPVPLKVPIVTILGTPLKFPKIDNPSKEVIDKYHKIYLDETQRLYHNYKNVYGWENRKLVIKG